MPSSRRCRTIPRLTVRLQRARCAGSRSRTAAPSASPIATRNGAEHTAFARRRGRSSPPARWSRRKLLMLSGIGPADQLRGARHRRRRSTCPGVGENLIDHPEVPIVADGERAATAITGRASAGGCCCNGLQFKLFGTGRITLGRRRGRRLRQPDRPGGASRRSRPSACRSSISTATRWAWSRTPTA